MAEHEYDDAHEVPVRTRFAGFLRFLLLVFLMVAFLFGVAGFRFLLEQGDPLFGLSFLFVSVSSLFIGLFCAVSAHVIQELRLARAPKGYADADPGSEPYI